MSVVLPDINIWLAYTVEGHPHHRRVRERWRTLDGDDLAFCRVTQMGYLRLLTTPAAMGPSVLTASRAWEVYDRLIVEQTVQFLDEGERIEKRFRDYSAVQDFSYKRWTDSYIAAFALSAGMRVLTLDLGFRGFDGLKVIVWEDGSG